jgi:hypothetical protein
MVESAGPAIAGRDHHDCAAPHRVTSAVEPEAMHLLRWPVALYAELLEERLKVTAEINLAGRLVR